MATGSNQFYTDYSDANTLQYIINQAIRNINTILPCKIVAVDNTKFIYTLEVLINFLDTGGEPIAPPNLFSIPILHNCGNNAGVIIEYAINDIVLVGFSQRDITNFKTTHAQSNPATYRIYDLADAIILNAYKIANPSVFVKITQDIIEIKKANSHGVFDGSKIEFTQSNSIVTLNDTTITAKQNTTEVQLTANSVTSSTTGSTQVQTGTLTATATGNAVINASSATVTASTIALTGAVTINGSLSVNGAIETTGIITATDLAIAGGPTYASHVHTSNTPGNDTGPIKVP